MTPGDVLRAVHELFRDPTRICRDAIARDATGRMVSESDPSAIRWDIYGAIMLKAGSLDMFEARHAAFDALLAVVKPPPAKWEVLGKGYLIGHWAKHVSDEELLAGIDRAIRHLESPTFVEVDTRGLSQRLKDMPVKAWGEAISNSWGRSDHGWWKGPPLNEEALSRARKAAGVTSRPFAGRGFERLPDPHGEVARILTEASIPFVAHG